MRPHCPLIKNPILFVYYNASVEDINDKCGNLWVAGAKPLSKNKLNIES